MTQGRKLLGIAGNVHPGQALIDAVNEASGNVAVLRQAVVAIQTGDAEVLEEYRQVFRLADGQVVASIFKMYEDWSDRRVRYADIALRAGIAEREVRMAEEQGEMIARLIEAVIDDDGLGLSGDQRLAARKLIVGQMRLQLLAGA